MKRNTENQPVIVLLNGLAEENAFIRSWLAENEFLIRETTDVFQVLGEISDFTVQNAPDVILVDIHPVTCADAREMLKACCGLGSVPVVAMSESRPVAKRNVPEPLLQLRSRLRTGASHGLLAA